MIEGPEEGPFSTHLENLIGHWGALKRWSFYSRRLGQAGTFPHCGIFLLAESLCLMSRNDE
jgi:hypothetical protein